MTPVETCSIEPEKWRINLRIAYRNTVPSSWQSARIRHIHITCWYLDEGQVHLNYGQGKTIKARRGDWLFCPPGLDRKHVFSPQARILSLGLEIEKPTGGPVLRGDAPIRLTSPQPSLLAAAEQLLAAAEDYPRADLQSRVRQQMAQWRFLNEALPLWLESGWYIRNQHTGDARLLGLLEKLRQQPSIRPLSSDELLAETGLSRVQLDRLARRDQGLSLHELVESYCLQESIRRLADVQESVKTIAGKLGFTDSAHFCRWFRRHTGHPPGRYRKVLI